MRPQDQKMLAELILKAQDKLEDKEFVILAKRYALDEKDPAKVHELARMLKLTEFEIRDICRKALFKLRKHSENTEQFDSLLAVLLKPKKV